VASSGPVAATHGRNGEQMKTQCHSIMLFVDERDVPSYRRMEDAI
jgi:hypothetical protein